MENRLSDMMQTTMSDIKNMVEVNQIIGQPIVTGDGVTLVPVSKLSFGFGGGGGEGSSKSPNFGGGTAAGAKIDPIGFIVIKEGNVRMLNIEPPAQTSLDRILDLAPQIVDKFESIIDNTVK